MKRLFVFLLIISTLFSQTRKAEVAGQFYTDNAKKLREHINHFISINNQFSENKPIGLIAPHAGYYYSGHVAGAAYKQIRSHNYETIIVLSPSHRVAFDFISVYDGNFYETPLGKTRVDQSLAKAITGGKIKRSSIGHVKSNSIKPGEHAIEVQLPFIQVVQEDANILPVVIGTRDYSIIREFGNRLKKQLAEKNILIIASSDLSHYHNYGDCQKIDQRLLTALETKSPKSFYHNLKSNQYEACGGAGITALMIAAGNQSKIKTLKYANSGDIPKTQRDRVVGYAAVAFYQGENNIMSNQLNKTEQKIILSLAEEAVASAVNGKKPEIPGNLPDIATEKRGAFVTLNKGGQLRGCIGYILPVMPLYETIIEVGKSAALRDPRFNSVQPAELNDIDVEVSVLTVPHKIDDVSEIEVGKHGIIIKKGYSQGLLLPQVATDYGWDRETFLMHTCRKAGLPMDAWKDDETEIKIFSAQVFSRESLEE